MFMKQKSSIDAPVIQWLQHNVSMHSKLMEASIETSFRSFSLSFSPLTLSLNEWHDAFVLALLSTPNADWVHVLHSPALS